MRTRGAVEDLVVVDLDDPDELESRGPDAQRQYFEDHYAELPFGLGTVPRRMEPDPWYSRPGVVLWVAIALVGLLGLAGRDDGAVEPVRTETRAISPLTVRTGVHLALYHVGTWTELDIDRRELRSIPPRSLPTELADIADHASDLGVLPPRSARSSVEWEHRAVCLSSTTEGMSARVTAPGTCTPSERSPSDLGWHSASSRSGQFTFVASGPDLLVIDALEDGFIRRVDMDLPPFEAIVTIDEPPLRPSDPGGHAPLAYAGMKAPPSTQRT
ncbi:MAG: hypothetical protein ACXW2Y_07960 [Acidimicrobiia bacterium]